MFECKSEQILYDINKRFEKYYNTVHSLTYCITCTWEQCTRCCTLISFLPGASTIYTPVQELRTISLYPDPADWFERRKTGVVLTLVQECCTTNSSSGATAVPVPRRKKIVLVLYNPGLTWIRRRPCTLWNCEHEAVLLLQS